MNISSPICQRTSSHRIPSDTILTPCSIGHCKKHLYDVYIGRPSKWGNSFSHRPGTLARYKVGFREEAIETFRNWITQGLSSQFAELYEQITAISLGCWCKPDAHHGDMAELVLQYY